MNLAEAGLPLRESEAAWLSDPDILWSVVQGSADVFLQPARVCAEGLVVAGARLHVARLTTPAGVFCAAPPLALPDSDILLAWRIFPLPGCRLRCMRLVDLDAPALGAAALAFAQAAASELAPPLPEGPCRTVEAGVEVALAAGDRFTLLGDDTLFEVLAGAAAEPGNVGLFGSPALAIEVGQRRVLPQQAWAQALGAVRVRACAADGLTIAELQQSAQQWLAWHAECRERGRAAEPQQFVEREQRSGAMLSGALQELARVARRSRRRPAPQIHPGEPRMVHALRWLAPALGVEFSAPLDAQTLRALAHPDAESGGEPVEMMAARLALRTRAVALRGRWWLDDAGPLLARRRKGDDAGSHTADDDWVALRFERGRYVLVDPTSEQRTALDEARAGQIAGMAFTFYRTLPARPLLWRDLPGWIFADRERDLAWLLCVSLLAGLLGLLLPVASGLLVDSVLPSASRPNLALLTIALLCAALGAGAFEFTRSALLLRLEAGTSAALQAALWDRVLNLPMSFFRNYSTGDLASRVNGINAVRQALTGAALSSLLGSVFALLNLGLMLVYSAKLAAAGLAMIVLAAAVAFGFGYAKLRHERALSQLDGRLQGLVFQLLSGIAKLRAGAAESRAFAQWARPFADLRSRAQASQNISLIENVFFSTYQPLTALVLYAIMGSQLQPGAEAGLSAGQFIAFSAAFGAAYGGLMGLAHTALSLIAVLPELERIRPVLAAEPEMRPGRKHPGALRGGIEVVKLRFAYPATSAEPRMVPVLHDLSFTIKPGEFVALVGPSGSGKSTLLRLLLGFEQPDAGSIYYDSQDLAELDPRALRRMLGMVQQHGRLLPGDLFTNVTGGDPRLTVEDAWQAVRLAGLEEDIRQMPMGLQTVVGEGSSTVSGGQRQRLMIARALIRRPRVLFLDEATSALDNLTQAVVQRNLQALQVTRIVIAHRLSTVQSADRILVLQDGRIVQSGSYAELAAGAGVFAELARRQHAA